MALSQRLDLRQTQALVMTPQLQQAIKLLQLSNVELAEFIDTEIERNPLLERDTGPEGGEAPGEEPAPEPVPETTPPRDTMEAAQSETLGEERPLDTDYENDYADDRFTDGTEGSSDVYGSWNERGGRGGFDDEDPNLEATLSGAVSLREHLLEQMNVDIVDPVDRVIGATLIDLIDGAGYITADLNEIAAQLGCPLERVEAVLAIVQRFDPSGIAARSLKECLANQLREKNRLDPAMAALLDNLHLLAARDLDGLMRVCGVDAEDVADMAAEIRRLDPKPALVFDHAPAQLVTPDILMRPGPQGGWLIDLNPDTLPRVLVDQRYFTRVSGNARDKTERDYLSERLQSANWLVKSLHQRATTILRVAAEIARQQDAFFIHGVSHLRPLILRDIAEAIGMHESTVSRVTTNKFISTPRGVFELKYFFTSAIQGADGQAAHSAEAVRYRIKTLIDQETVDDVLSDDRLVEILRGEGIDIARRTVAKYREAMRIPSSVQRRRAKSARM